MTFSLSKHFAKVITSPYNAHVSMTTTGKTGSGKSNANLSLAYNISVEVAKIKGGKPSDYFNINHVAIITRDEIMRVMMINKRFSIIMLDDVGAVGLSARGWQKEENQITNEILQTMRTDNTCVLHTLPAEFMLDKIPRNLSHWVTFMETSIFEKGISIGKTMEIVHKPQLGKIFRQYHREGGAKILRTVFRLPPDEIRIPYEEKRTRIAKQLKDDRMQDYQRLIDKINAEKDGSGKQSKQDLKKQDSINKTMEVIELIKSGQSSGKKISQATACREIGIPLNTFNYHKVAVDTDGILS